MKINIKNGLLILLTALLCFWVAYSLHLRGKLETSNKTIRELQIKQKVLVHKERLKVAKNESDSLRKVIDGFEPDTIFKTKIIIKHDTITERVLDSTYYYQLEWYKSNLNRLYPD